MAEATPALEALVVALYEIGAVKVHIPPAVPRGRPAAAWARLLAGGSARVPRENRRPVRSRKRIWEPARAAQPSACRCMRGGGQV
jgi:hypothetical protein